MSEEDVQDEEPKFFVKLTGIPFVASKTEVACFLAGCDIKGGKKNGVILYNNEEGRASGNCFVEVIAEEDVKCALQKDKNYMGGRYVHVATVTEDDVTETVAKAGMGVSEKYTGPDSSFTVKCRGLPWSATAADIAVFFAGCDLKGGKNEAIHLLKNEEGRPSGEAYVEFMAHSDYTTALSRDREHMGSRYIEVMGSTLANMERAMSKSTSDNSSREAIVYLRGLPWTVTETEIDEFFVGLNISELQLVYKEDGVKPSGECFVRFNSQAECDSAVSMSGQSLGNRFVEVLQSNQKYWHSVRQRRNAGSGHVTQHDGHVPPRENLMARVRQNPYTREAQYGQGMQALQSVTRAPRVKLIGISQRGGYDGSEGYANPRARHASPAAQDFASAGPPGRASGATKHCVLLKGVSCDISVGDIIKFFAGTVLPKNVEVKFGPGSMVGCAVVELNTHAEAMTAMLKDKTPLGGIPVNLELQSKPADYYNTGGYDGMTEHLTGRSEHVQHQNVSDPYSQGGYGAW